MEYVEFKRRLKEFNLSIKDFSELTETSYGTIKNWGKSGRAVPNWVKPFLNLYIETQRLKELKNDDCEEYKKALAKALQDVISKDK